MPYHFTSRESADKIMQEGFETTPNDQYFQQHFNEFYEDLSDKAKLDLDAHFPSRKEGWNSLVEEFVYGSRDRDGNSWERVVDAIANMWYDEHPNANIIWAAEEPHPDYEDEGLLEFQPEGFREMLRDDDGGTGYVFDEGPVPPERFKRFSPEEIEAMMSGRSRWR